MKEEQDTSAPPLAVVLGGAGLVGSHLCDSLLSQSCRVICLDEATAWRENNIAHLEGGRGFEFCRDLEGFTEEANYVFCLDRQYFDYVDQLTGDRWLVFSNQFEEDFFLRLQKKDINFRMACARQFFGPRLNLSSSRFLPRLIKDIFVEKQVALPGDGSGKIYPLHVKDLVNGLTAACFWPQSKAQVFYFAGQPMTAYAFTKLWSDFWPELAISFTEVKQVKPLGYRQEVEQTARELGWEINYPPEQGVKETVEWLERPDVAEQWRVILKGEEAQKGDKGIKPGEKEKEKEEREEKEIVEEKERPEATEQQSASLFGTEKESAPGKKEAKPVKSTTDLDQEGLWLSREVDSSEPEEPRIDSFSISFEEETVGGEETPQNSFIRRRWWWTIPFTLLLALLPFLLLIWDVFWLKRSIKSAQAVCLEGKLEQCRTASQDLGDDFSKARVTTEKLMPVLSFVLGEEWVGDFNKYLFLGSQGTEALVSFSEAGQELEKVTGYIFNEEDIDQEEVLFSARQKLEQGYFHLSHVLAASRRVELPEQWQGEIEQLSVLLEGMKKGKDSLPLVENFLNKEEQRILVLLQNNMELRPTGGFIGSYAWLTFREGRLIDYSVHDVYEADGQLKGQVEPPEWLKKYLGEDNWYLRDSNWSPDFPTAAQQAIWFYEKEMGQQADGAIGLNLNVIESILDQTGPVYLPDYDEEIDAKNLFERAEYHSEVGFFPGSKEKKNFLASLSFALLEGIKQEKLPSSALLYSLQNSLRQKDLLFYFTDETMQEQLLALDYAGAIKTAQCQPENCFTDYLWVVDTNVGANKANFFVKKKLVQRIEVTADKIKHNLRLTWTNEAQSDTWPGGSYKNFVRLYLPYNARLEEVYVEGSQGEPEKRQPETRAQFSHQVVGTMVEVPVKSSRGLEVRYSVPVAYQAGKKHLTYLVQKQGGTGWEKDISLFSFPDNWLPAAASPETKLENNSIIYQDVLDSDRVFNLSWGEKAE